jgi:hypothetical protein
MSQDGKLYLAVKAERKNCDFNTSNHGWNGVGIRLGDGSTVSAGHQQQNNNKCERFLRNNNAEQVHH